MTIFMEHFNLENVPHNPMLEELTQLINNKTQNPEKEYFRIVLAYFFGKMASSMRAVVKTKDRGDVPINMYAVALAQSGFGKGFSVNIIESELMQGFQQIFEETTIPEIAHQNISVLAERRAVFNQSDLTDEITKATKEYERAGVIPFTFDSGTVPALKQLRHTLLMGKIGAINFQVDEIASNLMGSTELLNTYLELYDQGQVKSKLIKNSETNVRTADLPGKTPSNMLLFGTPSKLFDGGSIEENFMDFLDIGYARRCLFAQGSLTKEVSTKTPAEIYAELTAFNSSAILKKWENYFSGLAEVGMYGWEITLEDAEAIEVITYKLACEALARQLPDTDNIGKAELSHRYFKTLKLAGALAFLQKESNITKDCLYQSIKLVEESGKAFNALRNQDKTYVRLAKYIVGSSTSLTHADLVEALPFYKTSVSARTEMFTLAASWGYKKHIILKRDSVEGIDMFSGEVLKETNLDEILCSYSNDYAFGYQGEFVSFDQLTLLAQTPDIHWSNHHFIDGHRCENQTIQGFNLLVIDVDGSVNAEYCHKLFTDYAHIIYTTKRSTPENNRFRMLFPTSHILKMDSENYRDFMSAITSWLPFNIDEGANQRSKKWLSNPIGSIHTNYTGQLFDVLPFIPRTTKYIQNNQNNKSVTSMNNLERWFFNKVSEHGRNNTLLKYALAIKDAGMSLLDATTKVTEFNAKLPSPLNNAELQVTVLTTLAKRYLLQP